MSNNINKESYRETQLSLVGNIVENLKFLNTKPQFIFINNNTDATIYVSDKTTVQTNPKLMIGKRQQRSYIRILGVNELFFYADSPCTINIESCEVNNLSPSDIPEVQQIALGESGLTVDIGNTPDVNVVNTPDINVVNTPDVNIVSMPTVEVAQKGYKTPSIKTFNLSTTDTNIVIDSDTIAYTMSINDFDRTAIWSLKPSAESSYFSLKGDSIYSEENLMLQSPLTLNVKCSVNKVLQVFIWK